jgi:hypothetical protein
MTEKPRFQIPVEVIDQISEEPPMDEVDKAELEEISRRARRYTAGTQIEAVRRGLRDSEIRDATRREHNPPAAS